MDFKIALQCAILCQQVYEPFDRVRFETGGGDPVLIEKPTTDTQLAILAVPAQSLVTIVFRGSDSEQDWNLNLDTLTREQDWSREKKQAYREDMKTVAAEVKEEKELIYPMAYENPSQPVKMHSGFITAYLSARDEIHRFVSQQEAKYYRITGHSLGGALATLCAIDLQYNFGERIEIEAYTFGSPRVGNGAFADSFNRRVPNCWRVVNGWDAVVGLPAPWQGYRHVEKAVKLERGFTWRIITGSFEDHRIVNYIDALKNQL